MKNVIILIITLSMLLISCNTSEDFDNDASIWLDVVGSGDVVTVDCYGLEEIILPLEIYIENPGDFDGLTGFITNIRVSFFRNDGGTDVPDTFDLFTYILISPAQPNSISIGFPEKNLRDFCGKISLNDSFGYEPETGHSVIKGYIVIQLWGTLGQNNIAGQTQFPMQIIK